jgi:DNA-binding response OmpR family regulator
MPGAIEEIASHEAVEPPAPPMESGDVQSASLTQSGSVSPADGPSPAVRRVLIAEDSLTARIFLARMLELQGFEVHAVASLSELVPALERGDWTLVCVDLELPDGSQAPMLRRVLETQRRRGSRATVVALVRDATDVAEARSAGVTITLRKPFDRDALMRLLGQMRRGGSA